MHGVLKYTQRLNSHKTVVLVAKVATSNLCHTISRHDAKTLVEIAPRTRLIKFTLIFISSLIYVNFISMLSDF